MLKFQQLFGKDPVFLAPMAGVTNLPFRYFCREQGANAVVTEFISVLSLYHNLKRRNLNNQLRSLINTHYEEKPVGLQVFGYDPQHFSKLADYFDFFDYGFDFLDLNVGCPVPKVCQSGAGARLLASDRIPILEEIIRTIKIKFPDVPFSIKIRAGYKLPLNMPKFAEMLNSFDLLMVTIHPRLAINPSKENIDKNLTRLLVSECNHPVIVSGNITSLDKAILLKNETKTAGTMIGRSARRFPWIFSPKYQEGISVADFYTGLHHFIDLNERFGYSTLSTVRKQILQFLHGFPGSSQLRKQIHEKNLEFGELRRFVEEIKIQLDDSGVTLIPGITPTKTSKERN
ncbi:MAG: tRNA dihydrouridine synthase [Candidatus Hodarchaeales archaeon]|jgi:tRNA-dihydrouridine synthase